MTLLAPRRRERPPDADALIKEARQLRRRRQLRYLAAVLLLVAGALLGLAIAAVPPLSRSTAPRSSRPRQSPAAGVHPVDTAAHTRLLPIPGIASPVADKNLQVIASGDGSIWALSTELEGTAACMPVVEVDQRRGCIVSDLVRIDATSERVRSEIRIGGYDALAYGDGAVWIIGDGAFSHERHLTEISPNSQRVVRTVSLHTPAYLYPAGSVDAIAAGGGDVYVGHDDGGCSASVDKVDAATGKLVASWPLAPCDPVSQLLVSGGLVWVGTEGHLEALDATTGVERLAVPLPKEFEVQSLAADGNRVWVAGGSLLEIDSSTGRVLHDYLDGARAVAASGGSLWAAEIYGGVNACSVSANWTPKCGEFFGELSVVQLSASNGDVIRRALEPSFGGMRYSIGLAVSQGTAALTSLGSLALVRF